METWRECPQCSRRKLLLGHYTQSRPSKPKNSVSTSVCSSPVLCGEQCWSFEPDSKLVTSPHWCRRYVISTQNSEFINTMATVIIWPVWVAKSCFAERSDKSIFEVQSTPGFDLTCLETGVAASLDPLGPESNCARLCDLHSQWRPDWVWLAPKSICQCAGSSQRQMQIRTSIENGNTLGCVSVSGS